MTTVFSNTNFDQRRVVVSRSQKQRYVRDGRPIPKPPVLASAIDQDALATLIYSGTIFPPSTIFRDFSAIGMGGRLTMEDDGRVQYEEPTDPFRGCTNASDSSFDSIDALAGSLAKSDIDFDNATLLLSEGKDSTGIALALAEMGQSIDCVTFANSDTNVEFVEHLCARLGHRLCVIRYGSTLITDSALERLGQVFEPTLDQAFLSYLLLPMDQFEGRTFLDGMGNDVYMGHLPSRDQWRATHLCRAVEKCTPGILRSSLKAKAFVDSPKSGVPFRTFSECQGLYNGFPEDVVRRSTGGRVSRLSEQDATWQQFGFERARALTRGRYLDTYSYAGKSIALAEMVGGRAVFPWADENIALQFAAQTDTERFQWPKVNKLLLRKSISKRIDYTQPKVGFRAPLTEMIATNRDLFDRAIANSQLLGPPLVKSLSSRPSSSPRYIAGLLLALWESASN